MSIIEFGALVHALAGIWLALEFSQSKQTTGPRVWVVGTVLGMFFVGMELVLGGWVFKFIGVLV